MRNSDNTEQANRSTEVLVERCKLGDQVTFRTLMNSYQQYAYAIAFRLLADEENARDIVQEAFIRVWRNLHRYRKEVKFTTWLYTIVVNLCYDKIKSDHRRRIIFRTSESPAVDSDPVGGNNVQDTVEKKNLREHIIALSRKLPPKEYLVFVLRDIQDFSIAEIAGMTGISGNSVKVNLFHARKKIRTELSREQL